eukprot:gene14227-19090_t
MFQVLPLLLVIASVAAFHVPTASIRSSNTLVMMAEKSKSLPFLTQPPNLVGLYGEVGFDPFGFSNWIDIRWLSEAEIKHCRIAMLAVAGLVAGDLFPLPGEIHQVSAVAAHDVFVKSGALYQVLVAVHLWEIIGTKAIIETLEGSGRKPGEFGFDPLKYSVGKSEAFKADIQTKELQNGRLAMLAFGGMITAATLTGKPFPYV